MTSFRLLSLGWFCVSIYNIIWCSLGLMFLRDPWGFPFQAENWANNPTVNLHNTIIFSQVGLIIGIAGAITSVVLFQKSGTLALETKQE